MKKPTGLLAILAILITTAGFTLGLTYAPCYSSLCSEDFFPFSTRVHITSYYAILASTGCFLFLRAYSPWIRSLSATHLTRRELPVMKKRISVGGLLLSIWLIGLTLATTAFWIDPEMTFWMIRTVPLHWVDAQIRLGVTGIIGHHADILLGLVLIPVSRNSILGRVFELHQSTLLYAHKLLAYLLFIAVTAHGAASYTFVATYGAAKDSSPRKDAFNVDNPTVTMKQSEGTGAWHSATLGTGMLSFLFMLLIIITALPVLRRKAYNTFYYIHVIFSSLIFISASIHASTDFYFLLPGLLLWIMDWILRLFYGNAGGLKKTVTGTLESAAGEWYRLTLPAGARKKSTEDEATVEKHHDEDHPLQTYYINIPSISKLQNHAFTAAKVGSDNSGPVLLFQRAQPKSPKTKQEKSEKEWTWKVGAASDQRRVTNTESENAESPIQPTQVEVRVEGPYIPSEANSFYTTDRIVCIVGGTGLTGAYSLALWWLKTRARQPSAHFTLIWTVRYDETASLAEWQELEHQTRDVANFRLRLHVSSRDGRMDTMSVLRQELSTSINATGNGSVGAEGMEQREDAGATAWVYVSGPEGLLKTAEDACVDLEQEVRLARKNKRKEETTLLVMNIEHYIAKWEV